MPHRPEKRSRKPLRAFLKSKSSNPSVSSLRSEEYERKHISRELHDEVGQGLMTLRLSIGMLLKNANDSEVKNRAEEALNLVDKTIDGLRRIIRRFSPRALEDMGLLGAIRREVEVVSEQTGMVPLLEVPRQLNPIKHDVEIAIYRCVQEALHNISKHSGATNFSVIVESSGQRLAVRVSDNGVGFAPKRENSVQTFGIEGMRERVEDVGGTFGIHSLPGGGTRLEIEIPAENAGLRTIRSRVRSIRQKAS
jgi:signal transduction histidine kinase